MKLTFFDRRSTVRTATKNAFSLVEMMTASGVFSLVIIALVYAHMFGLRQDQLVESKLGASDQSRKSFDLLARDIRSAKIWQVGNGNASSFTGIPTNTIQRGNCIMVSMTADTNKFVRYYFDTSQPNNGRLLRMHSPGGSTASVIASNLIGNLVFTAEQYNGAPQLDLSHKGVIHTSLQFCQYQYPKTLIGTNYLYDRYKLEFRYTPHVPDGP
jgi:Tfp pilus assembly protein PilW